KEKPDFQTLYKEREWFQKLVPEFILGSKLAETIAKNSEEIDKRIVDGVRKESILEEIELKYPGIIFSFYTDFAFASRVKNKEYLDAAEAERDPLKKQAILKELEDWKARVHRVLMVYIQEYGLGRVVGPRPNWSGVYRSDEWLMQHFKNPGSLVPNSIMPIFPFDETKFYALTHMLDVLGKKNRDSVRKIWENFGFDPELAFHIHCAQCHGDYLAGNGPVSEWIYPIPKNLRNAEFLRNLTRENVSNSIMHGIKGTPMPPWGETPKDKMDGDGIPVLAKKEIAKIVDWIFSMASGERVIQDLESVPKWHYEPKNIHEELKNEGNMLKADNEFLASLIPLKAIQDENDPLFDAYENLMSSPETVNYYIKEKYYTKENIESGKEFFEQNCSVCHGKEGDGTGSRGSIMQDAKPRKLTNLEWLNTRDDLRLLRSIKYGVPSTSMGAWGDLTSSLQRLQLVIFIRSLSETENSRKYLSAALYEAFDQSSFVVENARAKEFAKIVVLQKEIETLEEKNLTEDAALENFRKKREMEKELGLLKSKDQALSLLQELIKKENKIYQEIGLDLIEKSVPEQMIENYLALILLQKERFSYVEDKLKIKDSAKIKEEMVLRKNQMIEEIDKKIASLKGLKDQKNKAEAYEKLKRAILSGFKKIMELNENQEKILNDNV
ncbi:MAG TPA: c-type cytochrome, partial [Parachlamydiaceae bacterium]|nr:c-type cytochrome [Parachlamydiaceae bacterium]